MSTASPTDEGESSQPNHQQHTTDILSVSGYASSPMRNDPELESHDGHNTSGQPNGTPSTSPPSSSIALPQQPPMAAAQAAQMFVFSAAKAGMRDVDKDHVQKVVFEMSKDSLFFQNSLKQNDKVEARITAMRTKLQTLTTARRETLRRQVDAQVAKMETTRDLTRTKVVVDMDMFYAAVEMRDNPALRDKPLAVGGIGMLSTTNYVARKFGVRAAMPGFIGKELCPELVIVPPNFDKYTAISRQIRAVVAQYDPDFHAMSLDEVYCDITDYMENHWPQYARTGATTVRGGYRHSPSDDSGDDEEDGDSVGQHVDDGVGTDEFVGASDDDDGNGDRPDAWGYPSSSVAGASGHSNRKRKRPTDSIPTGQREAIAAAIVNEIRAKIFEVTQLTASAGIAANTMLAKICSDFNKPNGQYVLPFTRDDVLAFVEKLPVRKIGGIGKVMEKTLSAALEVTTGKELYDRRVEIFHVFSEHTASWLLRIAMGLRSASSDAERGGRKSYSRERTFSARGIDDPKTLVKICEELCEMLAADMSEGGHGTKTITLKLKCVDFSVRSRAVSTSCTVRSKDDLYVYAVELLRKEMPLRLRLMGVRASALVAVNTPNAAEENVETRKRQAMMDRFTTSTMPSAAAIAEISDAQVLMDEDNGATIVGCVVKDDGEVGTQTVARNDHMKQLPIGTFTEKQRPADHNSIQARPQPNYAKTSQCSSRLFNVAVVTTEQTASGFQPCPICGNMINAGNAIAIDVHVDACLRRSEGEKNKRRSFQQFFQR